MKAAVMQDHLSDASCPHVLGAGVAPWAWLQHDAHPARRVAGMRPFWRAARGGASKIKTFQENT